MAAEEFDVSTSGAEALIHDKAVTAALKSVRENSSVAPSGLVHFPLLPTAHESVTKLSRPSGTGAIYSTSPSAEALG